MGDKIQFYYTNLFEKSVITASTGQANANNVLDNDNRTMWSSVASSDATTETLELVLPYAATISSLFLIGNNIKAGNIKYWNGSSYVDFSTPVSWSSYKEDRKFSVNAVSTLKIKLTMTTTTVANTEKRVAMILATALNFELTYNPDDLTPTRNFRQTLRDNPRGKIAASHNNGASVMTAKLDFKHFGSTGCETDFANLLALDESRESFIINWCGDTEQVRFPYTWGYIKKMRIINDAVDSPLSSGVHSSGDNFSITMKEIT